MISIFYSHSILSGGSVIEREDGNVTYAILARNRTKEARRNRRRCRNSQRITMKPSASLAPGAVKVVLNEGGR